MTDTTLDNRDILEQQIQMLNLVQGIERNQSDEMFEADGGRIHYVFDENVFEMFVMPKRMRSFVGTFQSTFWKRFADPAHFRAWPSFNAQSAMLAAEYLLSGELPGQEDSKLLFMTPWHMNELSNRVGELTVELRGRIEAAQLEGRTSSVERDLDSWFRSKQGRADATDPYFWAPLAREPQLREDLDNLQSHGNVEPARIDRFAAARILARVLSEDTYFEPVEQLARLVSPGTRDRIVDLTTRFGLGSRDEEELERSATEWHSRLDKQIKSAKKIPPRRPAAIWSDAYSLALVNWVSENCDRASERVVLVTGDRFLYNAYLEFWSNWRRNSPETDPFVLRRIVQYAPILNMNNRKFSDISDTGSLIDSTQQAMEVTLLPFNLSRMSTLAADDPHMLERGRHYLALKAAEEINPADDVSINYFLKQATPSWFIDQQRSLRGLCDLWKQTERTAIGAMFPLVQRRLHDRIEKLDAHIVTHPDAKLADVLSNRANQLLDRIVTRSVDVWYPIAVKFINDKLREAMAVEERLPLRAPIAVRLEVRAGSGTFDLTETIERWIRENDQTVVRLLMQHYEQAREQNLLFAFASGISLGQRDWSNADHYAHLAVQAATLDKTDNTPPAHENELRYLHSIAKRFRVGEIGPPANERAYLLLRRRYAAARDLLEHCFKYHVEYLECEEAGVRPHVLKLIRTQSERAALDLFFAASVGLTNTASWSAETRSDACAAARNALDAADEDLRSCRELGQREAAIAPTDETRFNFMRRLRRQYICNSAAAHIVRYLVDESCGRQVSRLIDPELVVAVSDLQRNDAQLPVVVKAELCAYLLLAERDVAARQEDLRTIRAFSRPKYSLKIDTELTRKICSAFL